jgi:hypothetical protein
MIPESKDTISMPSSHVLLDQVDVAFDDEHAVAGAGLLLPATLAERLGIEPATEQLDKVTGEILAKAWAGRALGPGDRPVTVDVDSTICEVHGDHKRAAPATATLAGWATTRCWRPGPTL